MIFKILTIFSLVWHYWNDRQLDFHGTQFTHQTGSEYLLSVAMHCKDTIPKILNKYSQKRYCAVSVQFPHSCVYNRFFIPTIGSAYSAAGKHVDRSCEYINRSQTHECGIWDWGRAVPFLGIHKWDFLCSVVFLICRLFLQDMRALKPTILPAVPRFINRIYAR